MKKMKKITLMILLILQIISCWCGVSKAAQENKDNQEMAIYLTTTNQTIKVGEEFSVWLNTKNIAVAALDIRLYFDAEKVEIVNLPQNANAKNNVILYSWFDEKGAVNLKKDTTLVEFQFRAKQSGITSFSLQGDFYNQKQDEIKIKINPMEVKIEDKVEPKIVEEEQNNTTNLAILRLDKEGITPQFSSNIKEYYLTVGKEVSFLEVTARPENKNAKMTITGNNNLKDGLNTINIKVNAGNQITEYKIYVTKTNDMQNANSNLENLAIEYAMLQPDFQQDITNYSVDVENYIQNLNVLAVAQNQAAKVNIQGHQNLKEGNNTVTVTVTAPNGLTFKKYVIKVNRKAKSQTTEQIENNQTNTQPQVTEEQNQIDNSKPVEEVKEQMINEKTRNSNMDYCICYYYHCRFGHYGNFFPFSS